MEKDDEDKFEPKLQTENAGGGGSSGKTRIGANTPGDNSKRPSRHKQLQAEKTGGGEPNEMPNTPGDNSKCVCIDNDLTVKELAQKLGVSETVAIKHLFVMGIPRTVSQIVEIEWARSAAIGMGYDVVSSLDQMDET